MTVSWLIGCRLRFAKPREHCLNFVSQLTANHRSDTNSVGSISLEDRDELDKPWWRHLPRMRSLLAQHPDRSWIMEGLSAPMKEGYKDYQATGLRVDKSNPPTMFSTRLKENYTRKQPAKVTASTPDSIRRTKNSRQKDIHPFLHPRPTNNPHQRLQMPFFTMII
jgi:hypothetical protein